MPDRGVAVHTPGGSKGPCDAMLSKSRVQPPGTRHLGHPHSMTMILVRACDDIRHAHTDMPQVHDTDHHQGHPMQVFAAATEAQLTAMSTG